MLSLKGARFLIDFILIGVHLYAAYRLSYRHIEEMMEERGVAVDHSSFSRYGKA